MYKSLKKTMQRIAKTTKSKVTKTWKKWAQAAKRLYKKPQPNQYTKKNRRRR